MGVCCSRPTAADGGGAGRGAHHHAHAHAAAQKLEAMDIFEMAGYKADGGDGLFMEQGSGPIPAGSCGSEPEEEAQVGVAGGKLQGSC
jgi:hypothetical protein